jgi:hypothetical protein
MIIQLHVRTNFWGPAFLHEGKCRRSNVQSIRAVQAASTYVVLQLVLFFYSFIRVGGIIDIAAFPTRSAMMLSRNFYTIIIFSWLLERIRYSNLYSNNMLNKIFTVFTVESRCESKWYVEEIPIPFKLCRCLQHLLASNRRGFFSFYVENYFPIVVLIDQGRTHQIVVVNLPNLICIQMPTG